MGIDQTLVARFAEIFGGRTDAWGTVGGSCRREVVTIEHYRKHVEGKVSLGIYMMRPDDTCWWGAHDYDHEDSETPLALLKALRDMGVNRGAYLERTKSFHWRVWLLFEQPTPAPTIRRILKAAITLAGLPETIECFPKQDSLAQVELGNYVNLPYFGTGQTRTMVDPESLAIIPLDAFLATTTRFPVDLIELLDIPTESNPPLSPTKPRGAGGWHPCCESYLTMGATAGVNRNGSMFTFCKHLHAMEMTPTAIVELALSVNLKQAEPLGEQELRNVATSAVNGRRGSGYTSLGCEDPLWAPYYCSAELKGRCRVAQKTADEEGVIAGKNFSITACVMQRSRPPVFTITVNGTEISLTREQLMNFQTFRLIVGPEIRRYPILLKKAQWDTLVDNLLHYMQVIDAPDDASESAAISESIERYLAGSAHADTVEEMYLTGRPLQEEGGMLFTSEGLSRHLTNAGFKVARAHLWHIIKSQQGKSTVRKYLNKCYRAWFVPVGRTADDGYAVTSW